MFFVRRMTLSPRLAATASLVSGGGNIVDVGTDHAYLPAHLILTKKIPFAIFISIGILLYCAVWGLMI